MVKEKGGQLWDPKKGASFEVFNARPIMDVKLYCVQDVQFLPDLRELYWPRLTPEWKSKVIDETRIRILSSQLLTYQPDGSGRALRCWQNLQPPTTLCKFWNQDLQNDDCVGLDRYYEDLNDEDFADDDYRIDYDNDFEDWTRADWQDPPS
jgi:hypothetical protein